jgi:hypothetical protein
VRKLILTALVITSMFAKTQDLDIKAEIVQDYSTNNIALFSLQFTNNTQDWIVLKNKKVSFGEKEDKYITILNKKYIKSLQLFYKNKDNELANSNYLKSLFIGFINPFAGAIYWTANSKAGVGIGNNNEQYPEGHLYYEDIVVPPKLSIKRFMIISSKNHDKLGYVQTFTFNNQKIKFRDEQYSYKEAFNAVINEKITIKTESDYVWQSDLKTIKTDYNEIDYNLDEND